MHTTTDIDKVLEQYIGECHNKSFDEILEKDDRREIFYHFSQMRRSLFNWYSFKENAKLLEVGGEYGALTGLFCEKCSGVTCLVDTELQAKVIKKRYPGFNNLEILIGDFPVLPAARKYDYIILAGKLEYAGKGSKGRDEYVRYLERILSFLRDDGILLIASENRYGLRYFCGERDPFTATPFAGINRYPNGSEAYLFSRDEFIKIVTALPDMKYKLYYPVPDYKFPQLIYTDEYLPKNNLRERVVSYSKDASTLVLSEKKLYDDIVDNGVFPFFANSFLVECGMRSGFCNVKYAALSTDRAKDSAFATVLTTDNFAEKRALYHEGEKSLGNIMNNIRNIELRGIAVVPHEQRKNKLIMPAMQLPTLSDYLKNVIRTGTDEFIGLFDMLYQQILASSEHVDLAASDCARIDTNPAAWGIILKQAYIDMIPINCFYDGKRLIFFDQEFVRECFPANYTMFRALNYTYQFITFANAFVPLQKMKERYGLVDKWKYYQQEERKFVAANRNLKTNKRFWEWAKIDGKQILNNVERLTRA